MNVTPTGPALIITNTEQIHPLGSAVITIGRKSENSIVLPNDDLKASRYHCTITFEDGKFVLQDVGSANGTFLNDQRIEQPETLKNGDTIAVGSTNIEVFLPEDETRPRAGLTFAAEVPPALPQDATLVSADRPDFLVNPYVGPRTFSRDEAGRYFGRESEARELLSLIISERLVLFYAQSGAGKSSLLNTRIIPKLQEEGMAVLPTGRVSGELPRGLNTVRNIFVFNLLLSMDESDGDPKRFTEMCLTDFLTCLTSLDGVHYYFDEDVDCDDSDDDTRPAAPDEEAFEPTPYVLLIDQFEEIVTTHADHWQEREDFFKQLAEAMAADPYLWVVLSLREDYVAELDPYAGLLPGHLRARFYMQRMGYEAALEAVEKPAKQFGRRFQPGVAESLVDNLRQIRVHSTDSSNPVRTRPGQFVEPVQLQVVCYQLWQNLIGQAGDAITQQDLEELGNVDQALAQFYEQALDEVVRKTDVSEIKLRNWFETQLITEAGTRGTVYRGRRRTGGIENRAVDVLVTKYLLRSEVRTGGTWYELVHDRFVEPIMQSNQAWRLQQPLIQVVNSWVEAGKPASMLLEGQQLREAMGTNWQALGPVVQEYLEASQTAQKAKEEHAAAEKLEQAQALAEAQRQVIDEQKKAARKLRRRAWWITMVGIVAVLMAVGAMFFAWLAQQSVQFATEQASSAQTAEAGALMSQSEAESARQTAEAAEGTAQAESTASSSNASEAKRLLEAQQATQTAVSRLNLEESSALQTRTALLEATLTVQAATLEAPTYTPTATPVPPTLTPTPTGTFTPPPTDTPTSTPTATATPTPNLAATAVVQEVQAELQIIATRQQVIVVAADEQTECTIKPEGDFVRIWDTYSDTLGCPVYPEPIGGFFAEQPFENGHMMWSSVLDEIFVMVGEEDGWWMSFDKEQIDAFKPSDEGSCEADIPENDQNLLQPVRGFGAVWCGIPDIRKEIGLATIKEFPGEDSLLQEYENGYILRDSFGRIYILFKEDKTFVRQ
jgi:hypothetical protein